MKKTVSGSNSKKKQSGGSKPEKKRVDGSKPKKKLLLIPIVLILLAGAAYQTGFIDLGKDRGGSEPAVGRLESEELSAEMLQGEDPARGASEKKGAGEERDTIGKAELKALENRLAYDFIKTLLSEHYIIRYRVTTVYQGEAFEVETTYAVSGSSIALSAGDRATIVSDNKVYMINHTDRSMISWDASATDNLKKIELRNLEFAGSSREDGLVCETYHTATAEIKLFFDEKKLVRMKTRINGLDTRMDIIEVGKEPPADLFEIPSGYRVSILD